MTDFKMANKYKTGLKMWFKNSWYVWCLQSVKASISALLLLFHLTSLATYIDPTTRTNVNKVDPIFDKRIENYKNFKQVLEEQKTSAVKGVESEVGVNDLVGSNEARTTASDLSNIRAEELEGAGLRESVKEPWINEYLLDYSKPGMMQHKEDAAIIANGTGKMLEGLIGILKKLDIDCKQVKGNKEVEPQYYIQPVLELDRSKGDTIYDKVICEELRNKYNCNDTVTLKCLNKGGQLKETIIPVNFLQMPKAWWKEVIDNTSLDHWLEDSFSSYQRSHYWLINEGDPAVQQQIKQYMADRLQIPVQYIVKVQFDNKTVEVFQHWKSEDSKNFTVTYKDGPDRCLEWQENWDERCSLQ